MEIHALFDYLPEVLALQMIFSKDYFNCSELYWTFSYFANPSTRLHQIDPSNVMTFMDIVASLVGTVVLGQLVQTDGFTVAAATLKLTFKSSFRA